MYSIVYIYTVYFYCTVYCILALYTVYSTGFGSGALGCADSLFHGGNSALDSLTDKVVKPMSVEYDCDVLCAFFIVNLMI